MTGHTAETTWRTAREGESASAGAAHHVEEHSWIDIHASTWVASHTAAAAEHICRVFEINAGIIALAFAVKLVGIGKTKKS